MKRHFDILHDARREIDLVIEDFDALDVIALKGVVSDDVYEYFKNYIQVCKQLCSINATYVTAPIAYSENRASQRTCEFTAKRIETHLLEMEVRENRQLLLEWAEPPDWKVALKHRKAFLAITHFWQKSDVTAASSHRFDDGSSCLVLTESQNTEAFEYPPSVYSWRARHVWEYAAFFEKDWEYSLEYYESFIQETTSVPSDFDANRLDKTDLPPRALKGIHMAAKQQSACRTDKTKGSNSDHITAANGSPYTYDNNGNLLTKGSETFTYDWKNNLVRYQNTSTVEDVWLGYDIGNTLVAKGWTEEGGVWMEDLGENPEPDKYPDSFSIEEGGSLDELCEKIQAHKDGKE